MLLPVAMLGLLASTPRPAHADEGGVSFWVPGFFGSLAAVPQQQPGWSIASIYYHPSVKAGADVAFARQVSRGNLNVDFRGNLNIDLKGRADLGMTIPQYYFATPFFGGQAMVAVAVPYGRTEASVNGTLTGAVGPIGFTVSGGRSDAVSGLGDLAPMFAVRWNAGVHNYMAYLSGNIQAGLYEAKRLANLGIGHQALDAGGGYTYFNPQTGRELSATLGFTYNFENDHTNYKNGVDMHLDWGASQFLTKQWQVGLVGYAYVQLSCDSGSGNRVGCFESRVFSVGPQLGYIMPVGEHHQGYFNIKGYKEFGERHRAADWNVWLTFAISPAAPSEPPARTPLIRK